MTSISRIAVALLIAALAGSLALTGCQTRTSLDVRGSDTMVNLGAAWAEAFMDQFAKYSVAVQGGGSGTGIKALINKNCDVAQASRKIKQSEIDDITKAGGTAREFIVAYDGVAMVVNPANPVAKLTVEQLARVFRSEVTNWKDLGGNNAPIVVLARDTASGTHVFIKEHVVWEHETKKDQEYGPSVLFLTSNKAIHDEVKDNPNAIGYVGLGYISANIKTLLVADVEGSAYVAPSVATVKDKTYDLARPLHFYTNGNPKGLVKTFIDWVMGPEGQKIVADLDFVPVR